ncbi:hypothetical protein LguiA_002813 [Lonicera macranthoides]
MIDHGLQNFWQCTSMIDHGHNHDRSWPGEYTNYLLLSACFEGLLSLDIFPCLFYYFLRLLWLVLGQAKG